MSTKEVVKRLMHYVKPYGALLVGALVCAVIYVVMSLLSPVLIGQAVDGIIGPGQVDFAGIGRIALYLVFVLAAGGLFQWLMTLCHQQSMLPHGEGPAYGGFFPYHPCAVEIH